MSSENRCKGLGPVLSLCRRAGIDAALVKAPFYFSHVHPPSKMKWNQKIQNTKVAFGKVAFGTVRALTVRLQVRQCGEIVLAISL